MIATDSKMIALTMLLTFVLLSFGCADSTNVVEDTPPIAPPSQESAEVELPKTLDNYLSQNFTDEEAGIVVLIKQGAELDYRNAKGLANIEQNIPITPDTGFRLASVSKPFTALAVMQLVELGHIGVEDSLLDYVPELSAEWEEISIETLLSHRSGIPDFFKSDFSRVKGNDWYFNIDNNRVLEHFVSHSQLNFIPNSQFQYSNTNYTLLAIVIERVSGLSFSDYMRQQVFEPSGFNSSYVINTSRQVFADEALNYGLTHDIYQLPMYFNGAAGQVSSAADLILFAEALNDELLVSKATLEQMLQVHSAKNDDGTEGFGLGWQLGVSELTGNQYFYHTGSIDGFRTVLALEPVSDTVLVILSNSGDKGERHGLALFNMLVQELEL